MKEVPIIVNQDISIEDNSSEKWLIIYKHKELTG
jgi:hypothetical protein